MQTAKISTKSNRIFPNEETFRRVYEDCLEKEPLSRKKISPSDCDLQAMFEKYISAVQAESFRYAYQCGYIAGKEGAAL